MSDYKFGPYVILAMKGKAMVNQGHLTKEEAYALQDFYQGEGYTCKINRDLRFGEGNYDDAET